MPLLGVSASINANVKKQESGSKSKALFKKIGGLEGRKIGYLRRASHADNSLPSYHPTFLSSKLAPTQPSLIREGKQAAFTLAEVLITLGIIGVVAALTLPTLIQHHRKSVVEARLAKFYSTINQAITLSEVQNGDKKDWGVMENLDSTGIISSTSPEDAITAEEWYHKYLEKYIKVVKAESSATPEKKFNLYFPDGSMVTFSGSSWIFYPEAKNFKETLNETSGLIDRNRDCSGKSCFTFMFKPYDKNRKQYYNKGVEPYITNYITNYSLTDIQLKTDSDTGCYVEAKIERAFCTELIKRNGWKIPADYPYKF